MAKIIVKQVKSSIKKPLRQKQMEKWRLSEETRIKEKKPMIMAESVITTY